MSPLRVRRAAPRLGATRYCTNGERTIYVRAAFRKPPALGWQGNRIWNLVDTCIRACQTRTVRILPVRVRSTRWEGALDQFAAFWEGLEDPRTGNAGLHNFHELLIIALCAVLCGGPGAVDMGLFAKAKEPFLRGFLKLENEVPSHDTYRRGEQLARVGDVVGADAMPIANSP
jgi:DDE_Tnp_1-associated